MRETLWLSLHIVRRNWLVYRKSLISNIAPTVSDPAFMILSLGVGLGFYINQVEGRSYLAFIAPGMAVTTALWTAFFEASYGFYVRMTYENVFKAMLTTPIGIREVVLGEFLWLALKGAIMLSGVCVVLLLFGLFKNPVNLLLAPAVGVLVALPLGAIGLLATCFVKNINQFQTVYSFIISPLYFFSGIFFPVEQMAPPLQWAAKALPLYHGVVLSQALFWDENLVQAWSVHAPILVVYSAVLVAYAHRRVGARLRG